MAEKPKHDFHLVDPSPWPLLAALTAGGLAVSAIFYMHEGMLSPLLAAFGLLFVIAGLWWRDVVRESHSGHHKPVVQIGLKYGMLMFIGSEVMFFAAFFWAFFDASLFPEGGVWPPEGITPFDPFHLPLLNTLVLLLSGTTLTWAHHALIENKRDEFLQGLLITVLLGVAFTLLQAYEYSHAAFGFRDGIYASTFYMATGFHGFHVIVGTIFLFVCYLRGKRGHFTPTQHVGFEAAAWYWHFVDVVWLFLFFSIYWWGKGDATVL